MRIQNLPNKSFMSKRQMSRQKTATGSANASNFITPKNADKVQINNLMHEINNTNLSQFPITIEHQ